MKSLGVVAFLAPLVVLLGCGGGGKSTGITDAEVSCPPSSSLTYENFGKNLIATSCLVCHAGARRPDLSTQAAVAANKDAILQEAVYSTSMPDNGDLSREDRVKLGQWLSCGAP